MLDPAPAGERLRANGFVRVPTFATPPGQHLPIGVSMIRRRRKPFLVSLAGLGLAVGALAGCAGGASTPTPATPTASAAAPATAVASGSVVVSGSVAPSASPTPNPTLPLQHVDAALEDKLPGIIGGVTLTKFSAPLSSYVGSPDAGPDAALYAPWLVKFGKTPDDVDMAVALDIYQTENFHAQAIEVPGQNAAALISGFTDAATKAKWPVDLTSIGSKSVTVIMDPSADPATGLGTAWVYAKADILYIIVSDDDALRLEAFIKLP